MKPLLNSKSTHKHCTQDLHINHRQQQPICMEESRIRQQEKTLQLKHRQVQGEKNDWEVLSNILSHQQLKDRRLTTEKQEIKAQNLVSMENCPHHHCTTRSASCQVKSSHQLPLLRVKSREEKLNLDHIFIQVRSYNINHKAKLSNMYTTSWKVQSWQWKKWTQGTCTTTKEQTSIGS